MMAQNNEILLRENRQFRVQRSRKQKQKRRQQTKESTVRQKNPDAVISLAKHQKSKHQKSFDFSQISIQLIQSFSSDAKVKYHLKRMKPGNGSLGLSCVFWPSIWEGVWKQ
jgi:hypothetical protein